MELKIDASRCDRTGFCVEVSQELFTLPEGDGAAQAVRAVPPELEEAAREAAQMCPTQAIHVDEP